MGTPGIAEWYAWAPKKQVEADVALVESGAMTQDEFEAKWADILIDTKHPDLGPKSNQIIIWNTRADGRRQLNARFAQTFGTVNNFSHNSS